MTRREFTRAAVTAVTAVKDRLPKASRDPVGWCEIAGVRERDVIDVARELTSHGRRAAVDIHRGVAQHTNGFYNVLAWMSVNMLLGNYDCKGGIQGQKIRSGCTPGETHRLRHQFHPPRPRL